MNRTILNTEIQDFINKNLNASVDKLALQKNPFHQVDYISVLNQIAAKQKAKEKLPTFFVTSNIFYPPKISIEQTSSEKTAQYKSSLVSGEKLIDLSGGFGVDDYYFSKKVNQVIHCEINEALSQIVSYNFEVLNIQNIKCICDDSYAVLKAEKSTFDWIYIDPSRRNNAKGKVFLLKDCLPNVPELLDFYFLYSRNILIKTAPLLDLSAGISELKNIKNIHIVAVDNEVKELLWEIEKDFDQQIQIKTVNIKSNHSEEFQFTFDKASALIDYSLPKKYLFEPNSAIMKSGRFDQVSIEFNIEKLHQNSHLYTSDILIDFPGRIFEIQHTIPFQKKEMKMFLENKKANITTRNFPDSVEAIRKKWKIIDGGNQYCFFTTDVNNNKIVLICTKIK